MADEQKVNWPTKEYVVEGPAKEFMTIADVCSYLDWKPGKLYRMIRSGAFPRCRNILSRGRGWYGKDIAAFKAIEELLVGANASPDLPPERKPKKPPGQKSEPS